MKQVLLRKGKILVEDVPAPSLTPHTVLIEVSRSLISTGTEMASVNLSGASLLTKAKERPQEVSKVFQSIKVRGLKKTLAIVQSKLDEWKPLGYSCAGTVLACGSAVKKFQPGDRVACAGAAMANHAEVVAVPSNLVVKVPTGVTDADASFVTLGAIALQGVRRADVRLGETVCVIGLGLLGQLTVQILKAAGCRVYGVDVDASRIERALASGMDGGTTNAAEISKISRAATDDMGVDATIITASTSSSEPAQNAFEITRKKGRIVVVGAVGMDLKRSPFYEKEQDFLISCSYGPGRYDPEYEQNGVDYPAAYVRWTENRNMKAFIDLLNQKKVSVAALVEKEFSIEEGNQAYELLAQSEPARQSAGGGPKPLAIVLTYPQQNGTSPKAPIIKNKSVPITGKVRLGLIGCGNFVKTTHLPNLKHLSAQVQVTGVCAANSASAHTVARQLGASVVATDYREFVQDSALDAVLISTRHNTHAEIAIAALKAGKHVFLEKPLALTEDELAALDVAAQDSNKTVMVGFNRRYAPVTDRIRKQLSKRSLPAMALFRVNAGELPRQHWTKNDEGGGRLRGEACHMVDFFQSIFGSRLTAVSITALSSSEAARSDENFSAQLQYEDGSIGTLVYTSLGNSTVAKEIVEVNFDGKTAYIEDFKKIHFSGVKGQNWDGAQDKGHLNALKTFFDAIKKGERFPIPWSDLCDTTRACIEMDRAVWGQLPESCAVS